MRERASLLERVAEVDAALVAAGVRPVQKVIGRAREVSVDVLALVADGVSAAKDIAEQTGQTPHAVAQMLHLLAKAGEIHRVRKGEYALGAA